MKTHRDLLVWQKSIDFVVDLYRVTESFPNSEVFLLANQIRKCSTSIPANIAEGAGRKGDKEFGRFLHISLGSATELETHLIIASKLEYIKEDEFLILNNTLTEICKMLIGLIKSLK